MNDNEASNVGADTGPQTTRTAPRIVRLVVILVSVTIAREVIQSVIPRDANFVWRLFGGAAIAGLIGAVVWYVIFPPVWRYISRRPNAF
jgi:hypothetical protein